MRRNRSGYDKDEDIEHFLGLYGLDGNIFVGYFKWLGNMIKGDFRHFVQVRKAGNEVIRNMWISFAIAFVRRYCSS